MRKHRLVAVGATLLAATLAMTACGTRTEDPGTNTGTTDKKIAKIGVIAPLSGDLSPLGKGIQHSVELAVKQANDSGAIPGWTLEVAAEDDEAKADVGRNAATKLAGDDKVVGVVGTLNSSVSQTVQPVLNSAKIVQVSPANTSPNLSKGADLKAPVRTYDNYFRTCTTDDVQGPFAAKYLLEKGIKNVATIHDKKAYGQGLVEAFTTAFEAGGGKVVAKATINPEDKNFTTVISSVRGSNPQAIYYGGEYPQGAPLSQQAKAAGLKVPVMGGDGMKSEAYFGLAGATADGDLSTSVGAPPEELASAKKFIEDYKAANYPDPYEAYGPYSYDAANAIIEALKKSLASADSAEAAREATVAAMGSVSFEGSSGPVSFDEYGDATAKVLTVYEVQKAKWVPVKTGS